MAAGILSGLLGVGGGIVLVPMLVAAGVDQHRAHATSLLAILVISAAGATRFGISGEVDWLVGIAVAVGAVLGSTLGSKVMGRVSPEMLRVVFVVLLVIAGLRMLLGGDVSSGDSLAGPPAWLIGVLIGSVAGFVGGLTGLGGGVVVVPSLVFFLGVAQHTAEGTSLFVIVFTALAATRVNLSEGRLTPRHGFIAGIAGAVTAFLGASLALNLDGAMLSQIFGVFVLIVAAQMAWSVREWRPQRSATL